MFSLTNELRFSSDMFSTSCNISCVCCPTVGAGPITMGVLLNFIDSPLTHIVPAMGSGTSIRIFLSCNCGSWAACSVEFTGAQGTLKSERMSTAYGYKIFLLCVPEQSSTKRICTLTTPNEAFDFFCCSNLIGIEDSLRLSSDETFYFAEVSTIDTYLPSRPRSANFKTPDTFA